MATASFEHASEARAVLRSIMADPVYGAEALSNSRIMSNLLEDLLPDAPREAGLIIAAANARLADKLGEHTAQGVDAMTAIRLTARSFEQVSAYGAEVCDWVTAEFAVALGLIAASEMPGGYTRTIAADHGARVGVLPDANTVPAPVGAAVPAQPGPARAAVPVRPGIRSDERWPDSPFALVEGDRFSIGWQFLPPQAGGPCFATLRRNAFGMLKIVQRYPLTDEGWFRAWQSLMTLDPAMAERAYQALARRAKAR